MTKSRTCIACRKIRQKDEMLRIVEYKGLYKIDEDGTDFGRGAYVCDTAECLFKAVKTKALNRTFKTGVPQSLYDQLTERAKRGE